MLDIFRKWRKAQPHADPAASWASPYRHRRVNWRFWFICFSLVAIVISQSGYRVWKDRQTALELQRQDAANVSLVLAAQTSRYFGVFDLALQSVQRMLADGGASSAAASRNELALPGVREEMVALIRNVPGDAALLLFGADGVLVNSTRPKSSESISAADRDYFTHFRDHDDRGVYISLPIKGRVTGKWTIFLSRRLSASDGRLLGVVAAAVIVDDLQDFYHLALKGSDKAITLLRPDGVVLARYPHPENTIGTAMPKTSPWYGVAADKGGTYRSPGFFGAPPSIVYARLLDGYPMVIDVVVSEHETFALWQANTIISLLGTLIVSLSLLGLFGVLNRQAHRQNELTEIMHGLIDALPGFFAVIDGSGRITRWNDNLATVTGLTEAEIQGSNASIIAVEDAREMVRTKMHEAFAQGSASLEFGVLNKKTGDVRSVLWTGRTIAHEGRPNLVAIGLDMTDADAARAALEASEGKYRDLFENTLDAIMTLDPHTGEFLSANAGTVKLFGTKDEAEFLRTRPLDFSPERQPDGRASIEKAGEMIEVAMRLGSHLFEWTHKRIDGTEFPADVLLTRVVHGEERLLYATVRDTGERKRATQTIRLQADQYTTMLATTADGFLLLDLEGKIVEVSDTYCSMVGYSREELLKLRISDISFLETSETLQRRMATIMRTGFDRFELQHRRKDGVVIDIEGSVSFWREASRFLCFAQNITDRRKAERALAESELRLKVVLETNVDGIVMVDGEAKKFKFANRAFCDMLGYRPDEVTALGLDDVHPPDTIPEMRRHFAAHLMGEIRISQNLPMQRKDGSIFFVDISATPMTLDGRNYLVACFHDVTERKKAEERITRMARHDGLTGLANRGVFVEALQLAIARAHRSSASFAVLYLDLDHFKDVNDTLGHPVGDLLLCAVSERLRTSIRETDLVARFGGDEFAVLQTDIREPAETGIFANKLLNAIGEPYVLAGVEVRAVGSAGIAVFGADFAGRRDPAVSCGCGAVSSEVRRARHLPVLHRRHEP